MDTLLEWMIPSRLKEGKESFKPCISQCAPVMCHMVAVTCQPSPVTIQSLYAGCWRFGVAYFFIQFLVQQFKQYPNLPEFRIPLH